MTRKLKITLIGDIMCEPLMLKAARVQESYNFDYRYTYEICKIIIKYIPINIRQKNYQLK